MDYNKNHQYKVTYKEAAFILQQAIDDLFEVGNGTTDEELHEMHDQLVYFRDHWFVNQEPNVTTVEWKTMTEEEYKLHVNTCEKVSNDVPVMLTMNYKG